MKTRRLIMCVLLGGLLLAPLALAAPDDGPGGPGRRGPAEGPRRGMGGGFGGGRGMMGPIGSAPEMLLGRMGEQLNLTDEQRDSLQAIAEANREAVRDNRQAVQEAMETLNEAAQDGDVEKIKAAGKAAGEALTQQALKQAEIQKKVNDVLTDAQKKQLQEMREQARERLEQMRQQRRERLQDPDGERPRRRGAGGPNRD